MLKHKNGKQSTPINISVFLQTLDLCRSGSDLHQARTLRSSVTSAPPPPGIRIPESLVVTAAAYRKFMNRNRLDEVVEGLLEGVDVNSMEQVQRAAAQIKAIIHTAQIPEPMYSRLYQSCQRLGGGIVLVWPVTPPYETFRCSREYEETPYLQVETPAEVIGAVKTWWASLFDAAAIHYRVVNRQSHRDAVITVAAQQPYLPGSG